MSRLRLWALGGLSALFVASILAVSHFFQSVPARPELPASYSGTEESSAEVETNKSAAPAAGPVDSADSRADSASEEAKQPSAEPKEIAETPSSSKETVEKKDTSPPDPRVVPVPMDAVVSSAPSPPGLGTGNKEPPLLTPESVPPPPPPGVVPADLKPNVSDWQRDISPNVQPQIAPVAVSPAKPAPALKELVNCPWTLSLKVEKGRTIVTAQIGTESSFTVACDRLEVQSPQGSLKAMGDVRVTGPSLEGTCAALTLNLQGDRVLLEGDVKVKSTREGGDLELTGDRLSLRIVDGATGRATPPPRPNAFRTLPSERAFDFWVGNFR